MKGISSCRHDWFDLNVPRYLSMLSCTYFKDMLPDDKTHIRHVYKHLARCKLCWRGYQRTKLDWLNEIVEHGESPEAEGAIIRRNEVYLNFNEGPIAHR